MTTEARINAATGIAEHKHPGKPGWHWACAGHFVDGLMMHWDDGAKHRAANAATPIWRGGSTLEQRELYHRALTRQVVHHINGQVDYNAAPERAM